MSASNRVTDDFRKLAYRVERYLRLEATERLTVVTSYVVLIAVVLALATSAIFFLSTGTVKALTLLMLQIMKLWLIQTTRLNNYQLNISVLLRM